MSSYSLQDWNWQDLVGTGWNTHSGPPKKTIPIHGNPQRSFLGVTWEIPQNYHTLLLFHSPQNGKFNHPCSKTRGTTRDKNLFWFGISHVFEGLKTLHFFHEWKRVQRIELILTYNIVPAESKHASLNLKAKCLWINNESPTNSKKNQWDLNIPHAKEKQQDNRHWCQAGQNLTTFLVAEPFPSI